MNKINNTTWVLWCYRSKQNSAYLSEKKSYFYSVSEKIQEAL